MSTKSISDIQQCLNTRDFSTLQSIGIKSGFGSNNTLRLKCYAFLLGVDSIDVYDQNGEGRSDKFFGGHDDQESNTKLQNQYSDQIGKDINRNGLSSSWYPPNLSPIQKQHDLNQIQKLLNFVYSKYTEFHYTQSIDSVFSSFYLLSNGNLFIAQKLLVQYLLIFRSDITLHDDCVGDLKLLWDTLRRYDSKFTKWLTSLWEEEDTPCFPALKWYISWFTHSSITEFHLILRMFDAMLSSQSPLVGLYMIIAVLLTQKEKIKECVSEPGELVLFINTFQFDEDSVHKAIRKCTQIVEGERKHRGKLERKRSRSRSRSRPRSPRNAKTPRSPRLSLGSGAMWEGLKKATTKAIESVSPRVVINKK